MSEKETPTTDKPIKGTIATAISVTALIVSGISLSQSCRMQKIAARQSFIDEKYEVLCLIQEQLTRTHELGLRMAAFTDPQPSAMLQEYRSIVETRMPLLDKSYTFVKNLDTRNVSSEDELQIREAYGLLRQFQTLLTAAERLLSIAEKTKMLNNDDSESLVPQ